MADNYLEKKMEEYRSGAYRKPERRSPSGVKPHTAQLPCALRGAFIIGSERLSPLLQACATALRSTSCRTAFCCTDKSFGNATAQALGLQYYPIKDNERATILSVMDNARENLGEIDVVAIEEKGKLNVDIYGSKSIISPAADCPEDIFTLSASRLVIYLSLPQSADLGVAGRYLVGSDGHLSIIKD